MLMKKLETEDNTTGETPEIFKLLVVTGVHKSISRKLEIKVELTHINQNKINCPLKY